MSENVNNSQKGKVAKAGAGYVIGNYLLKGITFLSAPLFSRLMSTADFGEYNAYLSYESIFFIVLGLALHSSLNIAKYKFSNELKEYVSSIVLLILTSTATWYVLGNCFFPFFSEWLGLDRIQINILIFHCCSGALLQVYNVYVSLSYAYKDFIKITSFNAISNIILSVILLLTVFSDNRSMARIVGTFVPLALIGCYIIFYFFRQARPRVNKTYWKFGLGYSLPIVPHGISQVVLTSFDRIMIKDMVGASESGIYSFAYTVYALYHVAANSLENVWKPWVFEKMHEKDYDSLKKYGTDYTLGMAFFAILVIMVSPEIIKVLGDREYWGATSCVVPIVIGGFFCFMYTIPSVIEYYYEKTKFIAIGTSAAAIINIVLNYFCIKQFGYIAAAYTTLFTYFLYFSFHYVLARKIHGGSIFDTKKIYLISLAVVASGAIVLFLEELWIVRCLLEIVIGILVIKWADKKYDIINVLKRKLSDKGNERKDQ